MKLGNYEIDQVYCADCYKAIKELPDKSIDAIYTDVPYLFDNGGAGTSELALRFSRLKNTELHDIIQGFDYAILDEFVRVMKNINIFIWCSKNQIPTILNYFLKFDVAYDILVWCKDNPTPVANNTWLPDIEYCLYFREKGKVKLNDGYENKSKWHSSPINKKDKDKYAHPTIKPIEMVKRHLLHATQPNDIVLDCFMGSGTTCVASKDIGRHFLGFEIEQKWYEIAKNRLNKIDGNGQIGFFLT